METEGAPGNATRVSLLVFDALSSKAKCQITTFETEQSIKKWVLQDITGLN